MSRTVDEETAELASARVDSLAWWRDQDRQLRNWLLAMLAAQVGGLISAVIEPKEEL